MNVLNNIGGVICYGPSFTEYNTTIPDYLRTAYGTNVYNWEIAIERTAPNRIDRFPRLLPDTLDLNERFLPGLISGVLHAHKRIQQTRYHSEVVILFTLHTEEQPFRYDCTSITRRELEMTRLLYSHPELGPTAQKVILFAKVHLASMKTILAAKQPLWESDDQVLERVPPPWEDPSYRPSSDAVNQSLALFLESRLDSYGRNTTYNPPLKGLPLEPYQQALALCREGEMAQAIAIAKHDFRSRCIIASLCIEKKKFESALNLLVTQLEDLEARLAKEDPYIPKPLGDLFETFGELFKAIQRPDSGISPFERLQIQGFLITLANRPEHKKILLDLIEKTPPILKDV